MKNYESLLSNKNVMAFLALIKFTEGADYDVLFGGGKFTSFADHPRQKITRKLGGKPLTSSAAGAYQFLSRTWDECKVALNLPDFSPRSQDLAAIFLLDRRKALEAVIAGDWEKAITLCNKEWASLPGSPYGQPTKKLDVCLAYLKKLTGSDAPTKVVVIEQKPKEGGVLGNVIDVFRAGRSVTNPETWKNAQLITNRLGMLGVAALGIARSFGYDFGLTDEQIVAAASLVVGAVFLFNDVSTVVSSTKVGVFGVSRSNPQPEPTPVPTNGPDFDADVFNSRHLG